MAAYLDEDNDFGFDEALRRLKRGAKIARHGWYDQHPPPSTWNTWIVLMPELKLPPHSSQAPGAKVNDRTAKHIGEDTPLNSRPYVAMWNARGEWQPGWLASQDDILAEDWFEIIS